MKKITYLLLSMLIMCSAVALCACGGSGDENSTTEPATSNEAVSTPNSQDETEPSSEDNGKVKYTVTVVDEAGNPVAGAMVQLCKDSCVPAMTNDSGVAEFDLAEDNYDVKFAVFPEGYENTEEVYNFAAGEKELTITLKAIAE